MGTRVRCPDWAWPLGWLVEGRMAEQRNNVLWELLLCRRTPCHNPLVVCCVYGLQNPEEAREKNN